MRLLHTSTGDFINAERIVRLPMCAVACNRDRRAMNDTTGKPYAPDGPQNGPGLIADAPPEPMSNAAVRARVRALRRDIVTVLQTDTDPGYLSALAAVHISLAALDAEADNVFEPGDRVIVSDDGQAITVVTYSARPESCRRYGQSADRRDAGQPADRGGAAAAGVKREWAY